MTNEQPEQWAVKEIETVTGDFLTETGAPFYRIEIDGYCADFDYRDSAENFAAAIQRAFAEREAELVGDVTEMMGKHVENWPDHKQIKTSIALVDKTLTASRDEVERLREALENIRDATSAEDDAGENYRWDDREGALDYAYAEADRALKSREAGHG